MSGLLLLDSAIMMPEERPRGSLKNIISEPPPTKYV